MKKRIYVVIVVYGHRPIDTVAFQSVLVASKRDQETHIILWDNSVCCNNSESYADYGMNDIVYIHTPENCGLSQIYNRVIAEFLDEESYLLLLDQDTSLPQSFFNQLWAAVEKHNDIDLFLPMIKAHKKWVSPLTYWFGWGRYWEQPKQGVVRSRNCCAINSGMVISGRYLCVDFPGYDERLKFYGTDTQFMIEYSSRRKELCVLDIELTHDLSFYSSEGSARYEKFKEMRRATVLIYENRGWFERMLVGLTLAMVSLVYSFRYRSFDYLV